MYPATFKPAFEYSLSGVHLKRKAMVQRFYEPANQSPRHLKPQIHIPNYDSPS